MMLKLQGAGHELPVGDLDEDDEKTRELISQEEEAANQYEMMADDADSDDAKHIYNDIADEEKVHAGELFLLLLQEDPSDGKGLKEGMKEASEELSEKDEDEDDDKDQDSADLDTMRGLMDTSFRDLFNIGREKVLNKANGKDSVEKSAIAYRQRSRIEDKNAPKGEGQMDPYDTIRQEDPNLPPDQLDKRIKRVERQLRGILDAVDSEGNPKNFPSISNDSTIPEEEKPKRLAAHLQAATGMPIRKVLKIFDYNRKNNNEMLGELLKRHLEAKTPGVSNVFDLQTHILSKYPDMDFKEAFQKEYRIPEEELQKFRDRRESNISRTGHPVEHKVRKLGKDLDKTLVDSESRVSPEKRADEREVQAQLDHTGTDIPQVDYTPKKVHVESEGQVGESPILEQGLNTKVSTAQKPMSGVGDVSVTSNLSETPEPAKKVIDSAKEEIKANSMPPTPEQVKNKMDQTAGRHRRQSKRTLMGMQSSKPKDSGFKNEGDDVA